MLSSLYSALSSTVSEFLKDDETYTADELRSAVSNAMSLCGNLSSFHFHVEKEFPHRVDALAVVEEFEQMLSDQHGGLSPHVFLHYLEFGKYRRTTSREDKLAKREVCRRWSDKDKIDREFRPFNISDAGQKKWKP